MESAPYLRNRRTGVVLRYNEHLATHPDMAPCDELPWEEKAQPLKRRKNSTPARKKEPVHIEVAGDAEIDDLLAGIDHG